MTEVNYNEIDTKMSVLEKEADTFNGNESTLSAYIRSIRKWPILTKEDEDGVWADPTPKNKERLINGNLRLVINAAMKEMPYNYQNEQQFMDVVQAGNLGLLKAANTYDPKRGTKFVTHAYYWIKAYIKNEIDDQRCGLIRKPAHVLAAFTTINKMEAELESVLNRAPTEEEMQIALDGVFAPTKLRELMEIKSHKVLSLNTSYGDDDESTLEDYIPDEDAEEAMEARDKKKAIMDRLQKVLTNKELLVIMARYGLGKFNGRTYTLSETADLFVSEGLATKAVSKERVRQIESHALEVLRSDKGMAEIFNT